MSKTSELGEFPIAKVIREKIFKIPLLPQERVIEHFDVMDKLLFPHVLKMTEIFPRLQDYFQEIIFRIASGNTLGKNYFDKDDHEDDESKKKQKILKNSESRVLAQSFTLLRLRDNPAEFVKIVEKSGFIRGVFEEAVELFIETTKHFEDSVRGLKKAQQENSTDYIQHEGILETIQTLLGVRDEKLIQQWVRDTNHIWTQYLAHRENLIAPYFRMVYTIAKKSSTSDAQTLDNFQNGTFGLIRAVKCYTPSRFAAFSVVAKMWIRQSILLNLKSEVNFIKLPVANWHVFQKLEKVRQKIEHNTGTDASLEEISRQSKIPIEKVQKIYENAKLVKVFSLNAPTQTEDDQTGSAKWNLESIQSEENIEEQMAFKSEFQLIQQVADFFDTEEKTIFGLISGCFSLIPQVELDPQEVLKEALRQKAARWGIGITFK
jgi:RNA polymerase sigma factor (sigma-70 family)